MEEVIRKMEKILERLIGLEGKMDDLKEDIRHLRGRMDKIEKRMDEIEREFIDELRELREKELALQSQLSFYEAVGAAKKFIPTPNKLSRLDAVIFSTKEEKNLLGKY